jgi:bifunctional ADP-heptose synthase (sugar kinase/adenylyltransferase)
VDTRTKIIAFEQAVDLARSKRVRWVTGAFDPLLIEHARQLRQFAEPDHSLVVIVTNPANPLLSQRARAELVAGLSIVDHVVIKDGPVHSSEPDESRISEAFIQRVMLRARPGQ